MQDCLIALLEWELCAAQARIAEYRQRCERLLEGTKILPGKTPQDFSSNDVTALRCRRLAALRMLLDEPDDHTRLMRRLESARYEVTHPR